jgi:putative flippase GtrA
VRLLKLDISREATKYLIVGAGGYILDAGLFNLLSILAIINDSADQPILFKGLSSVLGVTFTYVANSRWTFRSRQGRPEGIKRIAMYALVNVVGIGIILGSLGVSRYLLGFDSLFADNVSANVIGTGLALVFRFLANRYWVFLKS